MKYLALVAVVALTGCSVASDPLDTKLADLDFSDPTSLQGVTQELTPQDRRSFMAYAMTRAALPNLEPVDPDGTEPDTVRSVIEMMNAISALNVERTRLIDRQGEIIPNGVEPSEQAEWDRLSIEIAEYDRKLDALRGR